MTTVEMDELTKVFGESETDGVVAVDGVSLEVQDGDFLVLLGPSGCGKTTTLRMVAGLEGPTDGEVRFDGTVVNDVKARNRDIAMVFQDFALYPHMTIRRNLGFGLEREDNDLSSDEIRAEVEEVAEMLGIPELLDAHPAELSGGQKQRVALGRAIAREPRLFLFDEPLANLDAQLRKAMRTEIDELQSRVGITSVYVTHNQEEAMTIADRIAILDDGKLQQHGTPDEVFNEPANLFVAQFVGSPTMNTYTASLTAQSGAYRIETVDVTFDIPGELVDTDMEREDVIVGFRPQDLYQARHRTTAGPDIETDVRVVEPLGTEAIVHAETASDDITTKLRDFHDISSGQELTLTIAPEHVYLFDASTGELLKGRLMTERSDTHHLNRAEI
jgi:multiple sugar transport system ATP-binding protein